MAEKVDELTVKLAVEAGARGRPGVPGRTPNRGAAGGKIDVQAHVRVRNGKIQKVGKYQRGGADGSPDIEGNDGKPLIQLRGYRKLLTEQHNEAYAQRAIEEIRSKFRRTGTLNMGAIAKGMREISDSSVASSKTVPDAKSKEELAAAIRREFYERRQERRERTQERREERQDDK